MRLRRPQRHAFAPAVLLCAVAVLGACKGDASPTGTIGTTATPNTVSIGSGALTVRIAATRAARETGLMGVTRMAADSGMLFVFADDRQRPFWMQGTPIPLSIAFLDSTRKVIYLADMAPNTTTQYGGLNAGRMRYAIEVNQGWFASHAVTVGTYATFTLPTGLVIETDP